MDKVQVRVNQILAVKADSVIAIELAHPIVQGWVVVTADNTLLTVFCGNTSLFPPRNLLHALQYTTEDLSLFTAW